MVKPAQAPVQTARPDSRFKLPQLRWTVCGLLFAASTVNYVDRLTISVLKPHLESVLKISESDYGWIVFAFQLAYAVMLPISGLAVDRLGTRMGYAISDVWWSVAAMAHALAQGAFSFGVVRFFLGAGQAGNFPSAVKAVAEWFPKRERALATGIFNSGPTLGAIVTPFLVVWITLRWGWQQAFIVTGLAGFIWLIFWVALYRLPREHWLITDSELKMIESDEGEEEALPGALRTPWQRFLVSRGAWGFIAGKTLTDTIWWFYIFWLPSYLKQSRGFTLKEIGYFSWIPFLISAVGGIGGGWLSGYLIRRGWSLNRARKTVMAISAFCMPVGILAVFVHSSWWALALIGVSASAHQSWMANLYTFVSDIFPKRDVGSVIGLGGTGGSIGGMIFSLVAGYTLQWFHTYVPLFVITGIMHPLAFGVVSWLVPKIEPLSSVTACDAAPAH